MRSDKKFAVRPTVSVELKDSIYRLAYIVRKPIKNVCEELLLNSLFDDVEILEGLSAFFKRDVKINNTIYRGSLSNPDIYDLMGKKNERISLKVTQPVRNLLYDLAYVMGCSISQTAATLIYESLTNGPFIEFYLQDYLETLDPNRKRELKELIKYIKREIGAGYSLADLLSFLADEPIKWNFPK